MLKIPVPESSYSEVEVTLNGETYTFVYRFNERSNRWKVDIFNLDGDAIVKGLTVVENFSPTAHLTLPELEQGLFYIGTAENTKAPVGLNNFGINKTYEMVYASYEELGFE